MDFKSQIWAMLVLYLISLPPYPFHYCCKGLTWRSKAGHLRVRRWFSRVPCEWRTYRHWCSCHWHYLNRTRIIILRINSEISNPNFHESQNFCQEPSDFTKVGWFNISKLLRCSSHVFAKNKFQPFTIVSLLVVLSKECGWI